jgi:hypothetical protein
MLGLWSNTWLALEPQHGHELQHIQDNSCQSLASLLSHRKETIFASLLGLGCQGFLIHKTHGSNQLTPH